MPAAHPTSVADPESQVEIEAAWKPSKQVKLIVMGQCLVVFTISLDMTILTASLPAVSRALNADAISTFWIASSYLLANAVVQPIMAALADIFGRRGTIFTAVALFTIGSVICCATNNVAGMLAGRTIQGIGGGGILSVNLIILSDLIPLRARAKYISLQQFIVSIGFNIAPVIGGALVNATTWRWLFYINLPFCAIALAIVPFVLRYQRPENTIQDKLSSVDWIGSGAFITGMTAFLVGVTWGGTQYPWSSAATLVPLIVGLAIVFLTGIYERFLATANFLRLSLFHTWSAISIYLCSVLQAMCLFTEVYFLCLWLMSVKQYTPIDAGVYILAFGLVCVPVSGIVGPIVVRVGSYRWAIWTGWILNTLAIGLLTLLDAEIPTYAWVLLFITAGLGQGILFIAHSVASQAACQQRDAGHAMAMYSFMRSLGLCFGVALGGTIFQNFLQRRLAEVGLPVAIAKNSEGFAHLLHTMADSEEKRQVLGAYAWAFQKLFATICGISGVGLIVAVVFIKGHSLNQKLETQHVLKEDERVRRRKSIESFVAPV
ncbi:hypothetical protein CERZMDRAFT_64621 [Cercospora zeae-maydis SCOH1-5]|uniref:Major facilitator superfamily (MFS) profile domain-containing protein n=1 Tax=Cercospora zeae-maydis SCOH1-5 TaxID=717836 RepID=A0A6A6FRN3_9PEZI|nr:hypothetical protein CERZMDRAFT_64621 [Cercospora zeae-maydis SCOH1-5]